jgi:hypothetical protein
MSRPRYWLIAAVVLSATRPGGLAAQPLDGNHAAVNVAFSEKAEPQSAYSQESPQAPPLLVQRFPAASLADSEPASDGAIQTNAARRQLGLRDAVLAAQAVQPVKRVEFGLGLSVSALADGLTGWRGVYLQSLDRVAEPNTIYGLLRGPPLPGLYESKAPTPFCCQRVVAPASLEQFASTIAVPQVSPTFYLFGLLRKKDLRLNLDDGWRLQAEVRQLQYSSALQTKVGILTVERRWESFRTAYSYQLERASGLSLAPSHVLKLDYLYSPRDSIGVSLANGRELADFGPLGALNTQTRNVSIQGQHWLKEDWAVTFQAGHNDHGNMPSKSGARFGLRHSF